MGVHSGKLGVVNGKTTIQSWSISDEQNLAVSIASNTGLGRVRRPGVNSWSGSFAFQGKVPPAMPGASFSFQGYTAPDDDASGVGLIYSGTAFVKQAVINWNWSNGDIIGGTVDFDGHLALTAATGAQLTDLTCPDLNEIALGNVQYKDGSAAYADVPNVESVALTITCDLQAYVNASTVVGGIIWTGHVAGPFDWAVAITQQDNIREDFMLKGEQYGLKLFTSASQYYELLYSRLKNFTGITTDRSGTIIKQTMNFEMDGRSDVDCTWGHLLLPGGTTWWPPASVPLS